MCCIICSSDGSRQLTSVSVARKLQLKDPGRVPDSAVFLPYDDCNVKGKVCLWVAGSEKCSTTVCSQQTE